MSHTTDGNLVDLEIRIFGRQDDGYPVEITLNSQQEFPRGYLLADVFSRIIGADPIENGQELFEALLADKVLRQAWAEARGQSTQLRIGLRIDTGAPELHALPWELLHEGDTMLAANADTPFSRYLAVSEPWGGAVEERPIRVLAVVSNPDDLENTYNLASLDADVERAILEKALFALDEKDIELDFLGPPVTLERIEEALQQGAHRGVPGYHILHYVGHGVFTKRREQAALYLQDEEGDTEIVRDKAFIKMLARQSQNKRPRLVFLAACQSVSHSTANAFLGLGPKLVAAGVPAVVAMQDYVAIKTARKLTLSFYRHLTEHGMVDCALNEARSTLLTARQPDAAVPVLFMRLKSGQLWEAEAKRGAREHHLETGRLSLLARSARPVGNAATHRDIRRKTAAHQRLDGLLCPITATERLYHLPGQLAFSDRGRQSTTCPPNSAVALGRRRLYPRHSSSASPQQFGL